MTGRSGRIGGGGNVFEGGTTSLGIPYVIGGKFDLPVPGFYVPDAIFQGEPVDSRIHGYVGPEELYFEFDNNNSTITGKLEFPIEHKVEFTGHAEIIARR